MSEVTVPSDIILFGGEPAHLPHCEPRPTPHSRLKKTRHSAFPNAKIGLANRHTVRALQPFIFKELTFGQSRRPERSTSASRRWVAVAPRRWGRAEHFPHKNRRRDSCFLSCLRPER